MYQWDEQKAAINFAKHGVRFEEAQAVFNDPFALEWTDEREDYGEERFIIIGMAEGRLFCVVYTLRNDNIRIISARGAEPHERRRYHGENA
ncbi:MAG: BrnT family toxin [Azospirillaceae bacterium]|nr:BrnT family toxin [Azospirillaceae bacterium]